MTKKVTHYNLIAKLFHWVMGLVILGLILLGLYMTSMDYSPNQIKLYALHKSFGFLILWLVGLRLIWRHIRKPPPTHDEHQSWERFLSKIIHVFLYVAMIGMPLSGWLMSSAGEYPVPFFGLQMPDLVGQSETIAVLMHRTHEILGYMLIAAIGLHVAGAFKHHFLDDDDTLQRMALILHPAFPFFLAIIIALFFAVAGNMILGEQLRKRAFDKQFAEHVEEKEVAPVIKSRPDFAKPPALDELSKNQWAIVPDKSAIEFKGSVYKKPFTGEFPIFGGDIIFNPEDLENSKVDISISLIDVETGDDERDTEILGVEWFHTAAYPMATFRSTTFEAAQNGNYMVVGTLTIRDKAMPVTIPFTLDIKNKSGGMKQAVMQGGFTLNRLDYELGAGQWEDPAIVGVEIPVRVRVTAITND